MGAFDEFFRVIQGLKTIIAEQNARFSTLIFVIRAMGSIIGPMNNVEILAVVEDTKVVAPLSDFLGAYLAPMEDFVNFLEDSSLSTSTYMYTLDDETRRDVISTVGEMLFSALVKVSSLQSERAGGNRTTLHVSHLFFHFNCPLYEFVDCLTSSLHRKICWPKHVALHTWSF